MPVPELWVCPGPCSDSLTLTQPVHVDAVQDEFNYLKASALLKAGEAEFAANAHPDRYKRE